MLRLLLRLGVNAVAIFLTAQLLPGIHVNGGIGSLLLLALIFGIVNALIKPIVELLTCPLVIVTIGLFVLVINGAMLMLTASLSDGRLLVDGWGPAIVGGIVMGIINVVLEAVLGLNKKDD